MSPSQLADSWEVEAGYDARYEHTNSLTSNEGRKNRRMPLLSMPFESQRTEMYEIRELQLSQSNWESRKGRKQVVRPLKRHRLIQLDEASLAATGLNR